MNHRKVIDYIILYPEYACGQEVLSLQDKVKAFLQKGWELYGSPFDSETLTHQAMVKYEDI